MSVINGIQADHYMGAPSFKFVEWCRAKYGPKPVTSRNVKFGSVGGTHEHEADVTILQGEIDFDTEQQFGTQTCISGETINNVDITYLSSSDDCTCLSIGEAAFAMCPNLSSVNIPSISIGADYMFYMCQSLTSLQLSNILSAPTAAAFMNEQLKQLDLRSLESIGIYAFGCNISIETVSFPVLKYIGECAFMQCTSLTSINIPMVETIDGGAFSECGLTAIDAPSALTVGDYAFADSPNLLSVRLPLAVYIGEGAFSGTSDNIVIDLSENQNFIETQEEEYREYWGVPEGAAIIYGNPSINVKFGSVGASHEHETAVTSLTGSLDETTRQTQLGIQTCLSGETVNNTDITYLSGQKFCACSSFGADAFAKCESLSNIDMPTVTYIGTGSFAECCHLSSIEMVDLQHADNSAFVSCKNLHDVKFQNLLSCGSHLFEGCSSLVSAEMPSLQLINEKAFSQCINLSILSLSDVTSVIQLSGSNHFEGCPQQISVLLHDETVVEQFMEDSSWSQYVGQNQVILVPAKHIRQVLMVANDGTSSWYSIEDTSTFFQYSNAWNVVEPFVNNPSLSNLSDLISMTDTSHQINTLGVHAFNKATNLSSVSCDGVQTVDTGAFSECHSLTEMNCKNAKVFRSDSFINCPKLSTITVADDNDYIDLLDENNNISKTGIVLINKHSGTVTWISVPCARNVVLPETVTEMYSHAGAYCQKMETISGSGILSIGNSCFYRNSAKEINLQNILSIGNLAFNECDKLSNINMPNVQTIEQDYGTFVYCNNLSVLSVAENNSNFSFITETNSVAKQGIVMLDNVNKSVIWGSIPMCREVVIPDEIKTIAYNGMGSCKNMTRLTCDGIETIGMFGLAGCYNLEYVSCKNVKNINDYAFSYAGKNEFIIDMSGVDEVPTCYLNTFMVSVSRQNPIVILVKNAIVKQKFENDSIFSQIIQAGTITIQTV